MLVVERIIVASSVVWAAALLLWRLAAAWGGGRKDYSARAGSPARGVLYNFTTAMAPAHKETARLHPFKFTVGMVMHAGVALAAVKALVIFVKPETPPLAPVPLGGFLGLAAAAALFLFVRRFFSPNLRRISVFDDYFAAFATAVFLGAASLHEFRVVSAGAFLLIGAGATFYIPLGKLRHVLFCPVARFDLGRRLGYRGTFPVVPGIKK
jgi:nitrate reductase gamma subunit